MPEPLPRITPFSGNLMDGSKLFAARGGTCCRLESLRGSGRPGHTAARSWQQLLVTHVAKYSLAMGRQSGRTFGRVGSCGRSGSYWVFPCCLASTHDLPMHFLFQIFVFVVFHLFSISPTSQVPAVKNDWSRPWSAPLPTLGGPSPKMRRTNQSQSSRRLGAQRG